MEQKTYRFSFSVNLTEDEYLKHSKILQLLKRRNYKIDAKQILDAGIKRHLSFCLFNGRSAVNAVDKLRKFLEGGRA